MIERWVACVTAALALSATAACGGDDRGTRDTDAGMTPTDDGGGTDAGMDAGPPDAGTTDGGGDGGSPSACEPTRLLVTTSDYTTGGLGVLEIASGDVETVGAADDQDTVPALLDCTPVLLERGLGNLRIQSVDDAFTSVRTIDLNPAADSPPYTTNPVAVVSIDETKAYVIAQARNDVLIVDPTLDGRDAITGTIDLSGFVDPDDEDGRVDATDAVRVGDRVYVALGNYWFDSDFAMHTEGSVLAVIDAISDTVIDVDESTAGVQGIDLMGENPWRGLWVDDAGERMWVGSTGNAFALDGMIEEVDLTTYESVGVVVDETTVGAEINGFAVVAPGRVLLLAGTDVIAFDPSTDFPADPGVIASGVDGMVLAAGWLWTWTREGEQAGLRKFDPSEGTEATPSEGPWTFGTLPIYGVAPAP